VVMGPGVRRDDESLIATYLVGFGDGFPPIILGFRACAVQVGCCRVGRLLLPNSGKPEFGWRIHDVQLYAGE
jgi:hypothetical protein